MWINTTEHHSWWLVNTGNVIKTLISSDIPVVCSYEDIACALIAAGCDTTVEDDCSRNGLYHAVKRKRELIIHALLDRREPYSLRRQCRTVIR